MKEEISEEKLQVLIAIEKSYLYGNNDIFYVENLKYEREQHKTIFGKLREKIYVTNLDFVFYNTVLGQLSNANENYVSLFIGMHTSVELKLFRNSFVSFRNQLKGFGLEIKSKKLK